MNEIINNIHPTTSFFSRNMTRNICGLIEVLRGSNLCGHFLATHNYFGGQS